VARFLWPTVYNTNHLIRAICDYYCMLDRPSLLLGFATQGNVTFFRLFSNNCLQILLC